MCVINAANGGKSPWKHDKVSENICEENEWHFRALCFTPKWLNSEIISSFISVIFYIPLVLGFLLNRGDQDLQVHPEHTNGKESEMVTLIFILSSGWRGDEDQGVTFIPCGPVSPGSPCKKITMCVMLKLNGEEHL